MMQQPVASIFEGAPLLAVENVSLSFGGVKAITNVSFGIRKSEICAIIGPNGAGKTSMLNVINGFDHPQEGWITFKGEKRSQMRPYIAASQGISRTFRCALFRGMTTLDNIMAGRTLKMNKGMLRQALHSGPAAREEMEHRLAVERIIDFVRSSISGSSPSAGCHMACRSASNSGARWRWSPSFSFLTSPWPA